MIAAHSIELLKQKIDIVEVVASYLELNKKGANYKGLCPFHADSDPSLVVSPAKQIYHCFSCGAGGDAIKFVMSKEALSYPEAIEKLADMHSFSLEYTSNSKERVDFSLMSTVQNYFKENLQVNQVALKYLNERGINQESIEKFGLGYAHSSKASVDFINAHGAKLSEAQAFGLVDRGENGVYARFIERITLPIFSASGNIVGFGGRSITTHPAKYINSPQTRFFNKSKLLYGYHQAKSSIYTAKEVIVTEGYLDTIMLHQSGKRNSVATLGTALTKEHIPLLKRGEPRAIVAYDGDKAGRLASFKAAKLLAQEGFEGGVVNFQEGVDPAEFLQTNSIEAFNERLKRQKPFIEYVIEYIASSYDLNSVHAKQKALAEIVEFFQGLDAITQDEYRGAIAEALNLYIQHINFNMKKPATTQVAPKIDIAELLIIKSILATKSFELLNYIGEGCFQTHQEEFRLLDVDPIKLEYLFLDDRLDEYSKEELKSAISKLVTNHLNNRLMTLKRDIKLNSKDKIALISKLQNLLKESKKGVLFDKNCYTSF